MTPPPPRGDARLVAPHYSLGVEDSCLLLHIQEALRNGIER